MNKFNSDCITFLAHQFLCSHSDRRNGVSPRSGSFSWWGRWIAQLWRRPCLLLGAAAVSVVLQWLMRIGNLVRFTYPLVCSIQGHFLHILTKTWIKEKVAGN
ncbi:hypothetical protein ACP275_13G125900 [Erythranthe tilingii]